MKLVHSAIHGAVLVIDFTLLPPNQVRVQPRVPFYFFSICPCELTVLYVIRSGYSPSAVFNYKAKDTLLGNTATRLQDVYIAHAHEPGRERLLEFLGYKQRIYTEHNFQLSIPDSHVIMGDSQSSTLRLLEQNGFNRDCLPRELGGDVDRSTFVDWINRRLSIEGATGAAGMGQASGTTGTQHPSRTARRKESFSIERRPGETDEEFAKRKNAAYVRRVRVA